MNAGVAGRTRLFAHPSLRLLAENQPLRIWDADPLVPDLASTVTLRNVWLFFSSGSEAARTRPALRTFIVSEGADEKEDVNCGGNHDLALLLLRLTYFCKNLSAFHLFSVYFCALFFFLWRGRRSISISDTHRKTLGGALRTKTATEAAPKPPTLPSSTLRVRNFEKHIVGIKSRISVDTAALAFLE